MPLARDLAWITSAIVTWLAYGLVAALAGLGLAWQQHIAPEMAGRIAQLAQAQGVPLAGFTIARVTGGSVVLADLRLGDSLRIDRITARLDPAALRSGRVMLGAVTLTGVEATLAVDASGRPVLPPWLDAALARPAAGGAGRIGGPEHIRVNAARVRLDTPWGPVTVAGDGRLGLAAEPFHLTASLRADHALARADIALDAHVSPGRDRLDGFARFLARPRGDPPLALAPVPGTVTVASGLDGRGLKARIQADLSLAPHPGLALAGPAIITVTEHAIALDQALATPAADLTLAIGADWPVGADAGNGRVTVSAQASPRLAGLVGQPGWTAGQIRATAAAALPLGLAARAASPGVILAGLPAPVELEVTAEGVTLADVARDLALAASGLVSAPGGRCAGAPRVGYLYSPPGAHARRRDAAGPTALRKISICPEVVGSQENPSAYRRVARRAGGSARSVFSSRAMASPDRASTSRPASGAATTSGVPQMAVATTGVPQAIASSSTLAQPSRELASTSASAAP